MYRKGHAKPARIVAPLLALVLSACGTLNPGSVPTAGGGSATVNASLEALSKLFAEAVTDADVRVQIHTQVAKRFDGDTNVLYRTLTAERDANLRRTLARGATLGELDRLAGMVPRLQVAVPAHFDAWDAKVHVPLVGYAPSGMDEKGLKHIRAFDARANVHLLDAHAPPKEPVIILSQNERTDDTGRLRAAYTAATTKPESTLNPSQLSSTAYYSVYVRSITLFDDYEPWASGDPEIMLSAASSYSATTPGLSYQSGFTNVNWEDVVYTVNRYIGSTPSPSNVSFTWWEDDGNWSNNDIYGTVTVSYYRFDGYTSTFTLGDMRFTTN